MQYVLCLADRDSCIRIGITIIHPFEVRVMYSIHHSSVQAARYEEWEGTEHQ